MKAMGGIKDRPISCILTIFHFRLDIYVSLTRVSFECIFGDPCLKLRKRWEGRIYSFETMYWRRRLSCCSWHAINKWLMARLTLSPFVRNGTNRQTVSVDEIILASLSDDFKHVIFSLTNEIQFISGNGSATAFTWFTQVVPMNKQIQLGSTWNVLSSTYGLQFING